MIAIGTIVDAVLGIAIGASITNALYRSGLGGAFVGFVVGCGMGTAIGSSISRRQRWKAR